MNDVEPITLVFIAALVGTALLVYAVLLLRRDRRAAGNAYTLISRVNAENARSREGFDSSVWPDRWPHNAPDEPFSTVEAHRAMQRHIDCDTYQCPRKRAAWNTLIEAGHVIPDGSRS